MEAMYRMLRIGRLCAGCSGYGSYVQDVTDRKAMCKVFRIRRLCTGCSGYGDYVQDVPDMETMYRMFHKLRHTTESVSLCTRMGRKEPAPFCCLLILGHFKAVVLDSNTALTLSHGPLSFFGFSYALLSHSCYMSAHSTVLVVSDRKRKLCNSSCRVLSSILLFYFFEV
jgi:hypothetical protein